MFKKILPRRFQVKTMRTTSSPARTTLHLQLHVRNNFSEKKITTTYKLASGEVEKAHVEAGRGLGLSLTRTPHPRGGDPQPAGNETWGFSLRSEKFDPHAGTANL